MNRKKTRFLILCNSNINRSKLAIPIFETLAERLEIKDCCEFQSAGIRTSRAPDQDYVNASLRREGYPQIADDKPRKVTFAMAEWADIILTMNSEIKGYVITKFGEAREVSKKTHILPHYGLPDEKRKDDIFDPFSILVSPNDQFSNSYQLSKRFACLSLLLFPDSFGSWVVERFTPYVPLGNSGRHYEQTISLYTRTIRELELCISGSLRRMKKEGLIS